MAWLDGEIDGESEGMATLSAVGHDNATGKPTDRGQPTQEFI